MYELLVVAAAVVIVPVLLGIILYGIASFIGGIILRKFG